MHEYLQVILILPNGFFYLLKWTSVIWGPMMMIFPFIYKKFNNKEFHFKTKFFKLALFSLYCVIRFTMSSSNLPINRPENYRVDILEVSSFAFTLIYSGFFFWDQRSCFFRRTENDRFSFFLGFLVLLEGVVNLLFLIIQGYQFKF